MNHKSVQVDLVLCLLLFSYGVGGIIDGILGVNSEFGRIAIFVSMLFVCGFGSVAHFVSTNPTRIINTAALTIIMIAQTWIYTQANYGALFYCIAFVGIGVYGCIALWNGVENERTTSRWIGSFDFLLSTLWVAQVLWIVVLHIADYDKIPKPAPDADALKIQYWGLLGIMFPIANVFGIAINSKKIKSVAVFGCGIVTGVTAVFFALYDLAFVSIFATATAFYLISFFEIMRED